jgi:hypothetical protein
VKDAEWLAELLAHGLVRGSFVPFEPIQQLRELTRARKQFVRERVRNVQRLQKTLEDANISSIRSCPTTWHQGQERARDGRGHPRR